MLLQISDRKLSEEIGKQPVEVVEFKGAGHPDSICDRLADEAAYQLCRTYEREVGEICHFNVDKALLRGGAARPRFGGGEVVHPIEIYMAGRATDRYRGKNFPVDDIIIDACRRWLDENLHALNVNRDVKIFSLVRSGSQDLKELFGRHPDTGVPLANDTSLGVGYAPLSDLEQTVKAVADRLTRHRFFQEFPVFGEDIKVMGVRHFENVHLTISCAIVDRYVHNLDDYIASKERLASEIKKAVGDRSGSGFDLQINTADLDTQESLFLTVTGTSGEAGDDGQIGRGNRVNGLITPYRPMSLEAAAGKNPRSHVGRIYNYWARELSENIVADFAVRHCETFLVSAIGAPINEPQLINLNVTSQEEERGLQPEQKKDIEEYVLDYLNRKSRSRSYDEFYRQA